jgi:NADH dehydrogenase (ubiquinone) 1 alpha subcomplex subunit 5
MSRIAEHPEVFNTPEGGMDHDVGRHVRAIRHGNMFVTSKREKFYDDTTEEWDGEKGAPGLEGTRSAKKKKGLDVLGLERPGSETKTVAWEQEPSLSVEQCVSLSRLWDAICACG